MRIIITVLATIIQNITFLGFMLYLANQNLQMLFRAKFLISFSAYSLFIFLIQRNDNNWIFCALIILFCAYTTVVFFNSNCKLSQCINCVLLGYLVVTLCQIIAILIFNLFHFKYDMNDISNPFTFGLMVLSFFILLILNKVFPIIKLANKFNHLSFITSLMLIGSFIIFCIFPLFFDDISLGIIIPTASTIVFLIIFAGIILSQGLADIKNKQIIKYYDTYMPILNEMIESIQKKQHLYNNQLLSLSQVIDLYDNYDDLYNHIKEIITLDTSNKYSYDFLHLDNKLLGGLLFSKIHSAEKKQIHLIVTIYNYAYISDCSNLEIVDLSGILIDNAIEASKPNDTIFISIGQKSNNSNNNKFKIKVENPGPAATSEFIHTIFTKKYTSKKNKSGHGLGLSIVRSSIKKYHGSIFIDNTTHNETPNVQYLSIEIEI